ncbi:MAG: hypothetical protein IT462_10705 [Planctomycetes bacterium]|nr:hypothetical protein [Planctomycetota bacterium]
MWDRSYRWQRIARVSAGGAVLVAAVVGAIAFSRSTAFARSMDAASEIGREIRADANSRVTVDIPAGLGDLKPGVLVYREREDGAAEVVGRVVKVGETAGETRSVTLLLTPTAAGAMRHGGVVKAASPTVSLEQAVRLLMAPGVPRDEAAIAKDALWPALDKHVLPGVTARIEKELSDAAMSLDKDDAELLTGALTELHKDLAPLEEKLLNRMAQRAWEVIGVKGAAEGVLRKAGDSVGNAYKDATDWVKGLWGDKNKSEKKESDFLSDETKVALRLALEEEATKFWEENREEITEKTGKVLSARKQDFLDAWNKRWAPKLYEKAVVPGWLEGEKEVLKAAEAYADGFARRRLLTSQGGPRLLLAFALRGALQISDSPLILIAPDHSGRVEFQWLVP